MNVGLLLDLGEVSIEKAQSQRFGFGDHPFERDVGEPILRITTADVGMYAREPDLLYPLAVAGIALIPKDGVKGPAFIAVKRSVFVVDQSGTLRFVDRKSLGATFVPMYEQQSDKDWEFAATDARDLPDTWTPVRHKGTHSQREPIAVGSTVRIAKGVLAQYMALLGDDEGSESLNNLTIVKYSEKHCVVRTEGGTRFAIGTRLLRRV